MPAWIVPAIGAAASLYSAISGSRAQKKALGEQQRIGKRQEELYNIAQPSYTDAISLLRQNLGLAPVARTATPTPNIPLGGLAGRLGFTQPGVPTSLGNVTPTSAQGQEALPFSNVRPDQLGIYNQDPVTRFRLMAAEENINRALQSRLANARMNMSRRGLAGGSVDAAMQAAIIADAGRQRDSYARQLAIQAGQEAERRIGALLAALGPGLGAGPMVANMFGQQGALGTQQVLGAGQTLGSIAQQYQLAQALKASRAGRQTGATRGIQGGFGSVDTGDFGITDLYDLGGPTNV